MTPDRALEMVKPLSDGMPFNQLLGVTLDKVMPSGAEMSIRHRPELANNPLNGVLHGGVISGVLDVTGGFAALAALVFEEGLDTQEAILERFVGFGTVDLRVDYLRPGRGESFVSTATVMRSGRRIAVTRMEFINDDGRLLSTGTGTYVTG